ncbi:MAG: hypothetical protein MUC62_06215 [Candidatus Thermoplasmatota archaeon]|jgi:hypothetical protein|nr:hypothetical protein [Candidatus Thermoplasmatota archaeon]
MMKNNYIIQNKFKEKRLINIYIINPIIVFSYLLSFGVILYSYLFTFQLNTVIASLVLIALIITGVYLYKSRILPSFFISDGYLFNEYFIFPVDGRWSVVSSGTQKTLDKKIKYSDVKEIIIENNKKIYNYDIKKNNNKRISDSINVNSYVKIVTEKVSITFGGEIMKDKEFIKFLNNLIKIIQKKNVHLFADHKHTYPFPK